MASTSVKSMVARMTKRNYSDLEEVKHVKIPKEEQKLVEEVIAKKKEKKSLPSDFESRLELFNKGTQLKCVRMPCREQRMTQLYIDDHPKDLERIQKNRDSKR